MSLKKTCSTLYCQSCACWLAITVKCWYIWKDSDDRFWVPYIYVHIYKTGTNWLMHVYIDGFMQKRHNSSALAMELYLFCIESSIYH